MTAWMLVALCGWIAVLAARRVPGEAVPVALVTFVAALLLAFQVLGAVELGTGAPVVTTANAALLLLAVALTLRLVPCPAPLAPLPRQCWSPIAGLTALTFALAGVLLAFGRPQGYEVMAYHLPLSVHLLQTQSLQPWDGNFPHTFPANASILWAVLLQVLPERLVAAANLLLLVPLMMAVRGLCRLAGADARASVYACCGLLGVPMIAFSSVELGADIGGIAFAALAMYFVLCPLRPALALPLAGLCVGLAFGFKSLHLISAAAIGINVCCQARGPRMLRHAALFGGTALAAGGFWLARNALLFGNPLHPVGVPLVGPWFGWLPAADFDTSLRATTQLEWVDHSLQWLAYPWTETQRYGQNFKHSGGLGAFVAAAIPATGIAIGAAVVRDGWRRHRVRAALLFAVCLIVGAWWLLGDRQPRYVLAALPLAMPLLAWVVTQAHGGWRRLFDGVLAACIVIMLGVFLSRQLVQFGDRIVLSGQSTRAQFYEYPPEIDALPAGAVILNLADRSWHYPLAGSSLANRVISMPQGRRLLGLPPSLTSPQAATLRAAPLRAAGITHVFVAGAALSHDACIALDAVGRLDRNPVNGAPLGAPRILYAVRYPCP
ncbi:hypothetical protein IP92_03558 [Pseudoduganella flava]|uniref:Glycosyltransferase RgtA/B/C/D-like domain-containing protein n=1 Tax=Pseudoduganella flava TaxID=871742 RepID=A0A562PNX1_9BURK|nr:hypothetical protein [Pseudoduganella flava]QGZ40671.1 hypothetical protein GO485_17445 [Pseudoduganella flava]TWI46124.1 hypothetical protein IP92_03558 [Pseudoduganella flava]